MSDPIEQNLMLVSSFLTDTQAAKPNFFFLPCISLPHAAEIPLAVLGNTLLAETGEVI